MWVDVVVGERLLSEKEFCTNSIKLMIAVFKTD